MNQPTISVIVPVYNGGKYIDNLMNQFIGQSSADFEMVFVDDGSRDDSYQTLLRWKDKVSFPMTIYRQENQGVSAARNKGIELAAGQYIAFVDSDDVVSDNYLKELLECAKKGIDVAVFQLKRITDPQWELKNESKEICQWELTGRERQLEDFLCDPTRLGVVNLLINSAYLEAKNIEFTLGYKYYEDYDFLLQLFAQTEEILRTECVLYYYLMQEGSAMGRFNVERLTCLKLMRDRGEWLEEKVPRFAVIFKKWATARLYWSVLWQAALALPKYCDFKEFTYITNARKYFKKLLRFPDWTVRISSIVFLIMPKLYWTTMRSLGIRRSKVKTIEFQVLKNELEEQKMTWMEG